MNHDHGQKHASSPSATRSHDHATEPGQLSRSATLRRPRDPRRSALVQRTGDAPSAGSDPGAGDVRRFAAQGISGAATTLPHLDRIQRAFGGHDVRDIQAHIGGPAASACQGIGARAYATGSHVAFREAPDLHTAAHEAAHVVQQRAGVQLAGGVGSAGDAYERNADQVADAVVAGSSAEALLGGAGRPGPTDPSVQARNEAGEDRAVASCPGCGRRACSSCSSSAGPASAAVQRAATADGPTADGPTADGPSTAAPGEEPDATGGADGQPIPSFTISGEGQPANVHADGGCQGLHLHGATDASFDGGRFHVENQHVTRGSDCACPQGTQCLHVTGTMVTTYGANVTITMPSMPGGLDDCERTQVQSFLTNVLLPHEQDHRARLETYRGQTTNPIDVTGCGAADVRSQVSAIHAAENVARQNAARALSAAIDPFVRNIDCAACEADGKATDDAPVPYAGTAPDAGAARDAGVTADAGAAREAGTAPDAGAPRDAGTAPDASFGAAQDAGDHTGAIQRKCAACGSPTDTSGGCTSCSTGHASTGTGATPRAMRAQEGAATEGTPPSDEMMDRMCIIARVGDGPTRRPFTSREVATLTAVKSAAASLTSQSLLAVSSGDRYMATVSQRVFGVVVPVAQLQSTVSAILDRLRSTPLVSATCADETCNRPGIIAYTSDDLSTIAICPRFFLLSAPEMRRTLIHEAGHAAGIDASTPGSEQYCSETADACDHPCTGVSGDITQNVDAWARFIECSAFSR